MYSPRIKNDLIPLLYRVAKNEGKPMTQLVDEILRPEIEGRIQQLDQSIQSPGPNSVSDSEQPYQPKKKLHTNGDLKNLLAGKSFLLDCGHRFTLHPWSNTLVLTASGFSSCHNCYE